jgi:SNF2 family DNA or RNA helicase
MEQSFDNLSSEQIYAKIEEMKSLAESKRLAEEAEKLRKKREEEEKIKKPVSINVTGFSYSIYSGRGYITFKLSYPRPDIIEVLRKIEAFNYSVINQTNTLPLAGWDEFIRDFCLKDENKIEKINVPESIKSQINEVKFGKDYVIDIDKKKGDLTLYYNLRVTPSYRLTQVVGGKLDTIKRLYTFPLAEAWRVYELLLDLNENVTIEYKNDSLSYIQQMVQEREELNNIAQSTVYEPYKNLDLNGTIALDAQTVGIRFVELAKGRVLIADPTGAGKSFQAIAFAELQRKKNPKYRTLVIVKASLVINWYREIKKLAGSETRITIFKRISPNSIRHGTNDWR